MVIVGDGPDYEELAFAVHALGLQYHVHMPGRKSRQEIFELYDQADIFFMPSVSEGIANVALEAMSMELPVVSSDAGGMCEVIVDGQNGLICPVDNQIAMASALFALINDFGLRKQLGVQARKTIEKEFHINRYIDVFELEYMRLMESIN